MNFGIVGFTPIKFTSISQFPIVNTPLGDIRAELKEFEYEDLPNFLCYNFRKITPVADQGRICGSCWALVVAGIIGDRISISKNKRVVMSAQNLIQCYDFPKGCGGESPEKVLKWMQDTQFKLTFAQLMPYKQLRTKTMKGTCPTNLPGVTVKKNSLKRIVNPITDKSTKLDLQKNIKNMKTELIQAGPFFSTIVVYNDLFHFIDSKPYESNFVGKPKGGHAIEIVGYCDPGIDPRAGYESGYWICKNSWGILWPKKSQTPGYFPVVMGKNMCGIESRCASIEPDVTTQQMDDDAVYTNFTAYAAEYLV